MVETNRRLLLSVGVACAMLASTDGRAISMATQDRIDEVVVVRGSSIPELDGRALDDLGLFAFDVGANSFVPVPFQVDERLDRTFNDGTPAEFTEAMYDVFGEEDRTLDADDELAFRFGDAADRASIDTSWPDGADPVQFEIEVVDPLGVQPNRWVYLFTGSGLPTSEVTYVDWDTLPTTTIDTVSYGLDYEGNWLLTGLRIHAPCGNDLDLIDRVKGRAETIAEHQDEEDWNSVSTYLGGISGPVRAIRYVQGARSAVNAIHHDIVTCGSWTRNVNLRVHELDAVKLYFDWLAWPEATLLTSVDTAGVPVDGVGDALGTTFPDWTLMRTPAGGLAVVYDVPESPLYGGKEFVYIDDAGHDDIVPTKTVYGDDDDAAYGAHGLKLNDLLDSNLSAIRISWRAFPMCASEGDAPSGSELQQRSASPLTAIVVPRADCAAIRTLAATPDGDDVVLTWQTDPDADGYRVYGSSSPGTPNDSWEVLGEPVTGEFREAGAALLPDRYYSVRCFRAGGQGPN